MFRKRKKLEGIFDDLPLVEQQQDATEPESRKSGKRAMLIPDTPYNDDPGADLLLANTGTQKEVWLELIYASEVRELRQTQIATYLQENYRVQKWWANSIALMYLKWRAQPKSVAADDKITRVTTTIPTTRPLTYNIFSSASLYGSKFTRFLKLQQDEKLVISFNDQTRATLFFEPSGQETQLIIEHEFLKDAPARKEANRFWQELLNEVIEQVAR